MSVGKNSTPDTDPSKVDRVQQDLFSEQDRESSDSLSRGGGGGRRDRGMPRGIHQQRGEFVLCAGRLV